MLRRTSRLVRSMCRAVLDLIALSSLMSTIAMSFTMYRLALLILLYLLQNVSARHLSALIDAMKRAMSKLRMDGFGLLKSQLLAALEAIKAAATKLGQHFFSWLAGRIAYVTDELGPDAPIALKMLFA